MTAKSVNSLFFQEHSESLEAAFKIIHSRNYQDRFCKGLKFESQSAKRIWGLLGKIRSRVSTRIIWPNPAPLSILLLVAPPYILTVP